ncbi:enoyl-CoA hydratase/isomerase family protein [Chloroflexota bacterium]
MDFKYIIYKREDGIATITLNRPERLNALINPLEEEVKQVLRDIDLDESMRVLILTGAGRAFCAGGDFKGDTGGLGPGARIASAEHRHPPVALRRLRRIGKGVTLMLQNLDIPTIAMVNGPAVGMGMDLAMACDMRIGSDQARFCVAWLRRGLIPEGGSTWLLPRIVGLPKAAEIIFSTRFVEAEEAAAIGLLNRLVPSSDLEKETMELASQIAKGPPIAIRLSKLNMYKGLQFDFSTAIEFLSPNQVVAENSEDAAEGARAFLEKREAKFKGK